MFGIERTGFIEKTVPIAGPLDAIVKTTHALICTSDTHTVRGAVGPREAMTLGGWKFANTKDGVFAEYFHVNEADANMALIPDDVTPEQAIYCFDIMSTGFMAAVGARLRGAGLIIAVETDPGGIGVDTAIEALGAEKSFEQCIAVTKPGGTISNAGYHGSGEFVSIPRVAWGVGMADESIRTGLCPGGRLRMERL